MGTIKSLGDMNVQSMNLDYISKVSSKALAELIKLSVDTVEAYEQITAAEVI